MLPMKSVRLQLGELLAADATTLAPAVTANKIHLIKAPFTPNEDLTIADLTFATFTGSSAKAGALGPQGVGVDPATQEQVITILSPSGGWLWTCTAGTGLPETIYGFALTDSTGAVLLGVQAFPTPVTIQESGQFIDLGSVEMTFVLQPLS